MKLQKKARFRSAISMLCATAMVASLFSGLSLKSAAEESTATEPTAKNYEFVDTFDSFDTDKWTTGNKVTSAAIETAETPANWSNTTKYNVNALNVAGTAGGKEIFKNNALVRKTDSPAGNQLLEIVFSGDYDATGADGIKAEANIIRGWGTGIVARAKTDESGNITDGYIVAAKMSENTNYNANAAWIRVYKFTNGTGTLVKDNYTHQIGSFGNAFRTICKLQVAITDNEDGSTTISYNLAKYNFSAKCWTAGISGNVTDSSNSIYSSGKSGVTILSEHSNYSPVVDFYNFSEKVKLVEPSDITAAFDDSANYNMTDWNFGSGITEHAELTDSFADIKQNITPVTKALTLVGTGNKTTSNTMMRNVDSAAGDRELSMVFGENYSYGGVAGSNWHNNSGAGIATRATVDANGKLIGGYVVVAKTTGNAYWDKPVSMSIHKVNADGSLSSALKSISITALNGSNGVWNIKMKLYVKVTDNDDGSTTIDYTIFAYNKDKGWYRSISDSYTDTDPINNPIFAGKSGAVVYSSNSTTPRIQIYEFSDKELIIPSDLTDDFESISADNWKFGSGTTYAIENGQADSTDKAVRITGTAGSAYNSENAMLRKAVSPDGNRFIEVEFGGYYDFTNGQDKVINGWRTGIIANATVDADGKLTGGYVFMAKMSSNGQWFSSAESMRLWKVNSDGTLKALGADNDWVPLNDLGCVNGKKIKLQLSVIAGDSSTTLKGVILTQNNAGDWVEKHTQSYTDNVKTVSGKSGVIIRSDTTVAPIVDVYSFKDVTPKAPEIVEGDSLDNVTMGKEYTAKVGLTAEISNALKFTVTEGSLPTGLFLNELTGDIVGIPLTDGEYNFKIKVEDSFGNYAEQAYSLTVWPTDDLIYIEIRKYLLGDEYNQFRVIDQNGDNKIDIYDLSKLREKHMLDATSHVSEGCSVCGTADDAIFTDEFDYANALDIIDGGWNIGTDLTVENKTTTTGSIDNTDNVIVVTPSNSDNKLTSTLLRNNENNIGNVLLELEFGRGNTEVKDWSAGLLARWDVSNNSGYMVFPSLALNGANTVGAGVAIYKYSNGVIVNADDESKYVTFDSSKPDSPWEKYKLQLLVNDLNDSTTELTFVIYNYVDGVWVERIRNTWTDSNNPIRSGGHSGIVVGCNDSEHINSSIELYSFRKVLNPTAPTINTTELPGMTVQYGLYDAQIHAEQPNYYGSLTYSANDLPVGLVLNAKNGQITWSDEALEYVIDKDITFVVENQFGIKAEKDLRLQVAPTYSNMLVSLRKYLLTSDESLRQKFIDSNEDGVIDILDLVSLKKKAAGVGNIYEPASEAMISSYAAKTDELIDEIQTHNTSLTKSSNSQAYYVSAEGNDANDGKSPENAWKTIEKVSNYSGFNSGDIIYFKRGDEFRTDKPLKVTDGVTYSAYGTGSKPKLIASIDASSENDWILVDGTANIWQYKKKIS